MIFVLRPRTGRASASHAEESQWQAWGHRAGPSGCLVRSPWAGWLVPLGIGSVAPRGCGFPVGVTLAGLAGGQVVLPQTADLPGVAFCRGKKEDGGGKDSRSKRNMGAEEAARRPGRQGHEPAKRAWKVKVRLWGERTPARGEGCTLEQRSPGTALPLPDTASHPLHLHTHRREDGLRHWRSAHPTLRVWTGTAATVLSAHRMQVRQVWVESVFDTEYCVSCWDPV